MDLDPELNPDIHRGLGTGFEFNTGLSGTFSTSMDPNGMLPHTLPATDNHPAPGADGVWPVPQISATPPVTGICDQVRPRPLAGQPDRALGHFHGALDPSGDPLRGSQALTYGLQWALVVTLGVRQPISDAMRLAIEPAMVPTISLTVVPANSVGSNSDYSVLPDPLK